MQRLLTVIIAFAAWVGCLTAQTYEGRVAGHEGRPLSGASVIALDEHMRSVSFVRSKTDGAFALTMPEGRRAAALLFSCVGYERDTIAVGSFRNGQTVELRQSSVRIREVEVKAARISQHGDTIDYSVAGFQQKQDRTIADVIKRMPGLEVKADGCIEFEGKPINKFYVEGMDLMGSKYAQTSENLQADKVSRVQVLQNHQPVKALKDVSFSEQAALNIVLKDEARNVWQGLVDLGGGHSLQGRGRWLADARLMAMMFGRRMQSVSMYKFNDTGKDIAREVGDVAALLDQAPTESPLLSNIALQAPAIDERRSKRNQTHVGATNWLFKTKADHDLRLQLNALADRTDEQQQRQTVYTDVAEGIAVVEDNSARAHRQRLSGELLYKVNTAQTYLSNSLKALLNLDYSRGTSMLNGRPTREDVKPRQRYLTDQLRLVRNMSRGRSYQASGYVSLNDVPAELLLTDGASQQLSLRSLLAGASTAWGHKVGRLNMTYTLSEDVKAQRYEVDNPQADAHDDYRQYTTKLLAATSYRDDHWRLNASVPLTWLARSFNDARRSDVMAEPQLFAIYEPTSRWQLMTLYNYAWSPLAVDDLSQLPVYTSYVNMKQGSGRFDNTMAHVLSAHLQYKRTAKGFMAQVGGSYSNLRRQQLYRSTLSDDGVYRREATDDHTHSTNYSLNGRVSEAFRWAHLSVALSSTYSWSRYRMLYADRLTPFLMRSSTTSLRLSAQPLGWLSAEATSSFSYSRQLNRQSSALSADALRAFVHEVRLFLMPGKWQMEWSADIYHSNDRTVSFTFFSDLSLSYRTKRWELGLACNNLLGRRDYERRVVTATQHVYTVNRLRPRELLARAYFSL